MAEKFPNLWKTLINAAKQLNRVQVTQNESSTNEYIIAKLLKAITRRKSWNWQEKNDMLLTMKFQ